MTLRDAAIGTLLDVEGGYVDHPADPGGRTNYGISQRAYPDLDIRALTRDDAIGIYERDYWDRIPTDLPDAVRWFAFDCAVNHGVARALGWLQKYRTLNELVAIRLRFYSGLGTFNVFGKGWANRVSHVLDAIAAFEREQGSSGVAHTLVLTNLKLAERWALLYAKRNPSGQLENVLRGSFVWRVRADRVDVRRA